MKRHGCGFVMLVVFALLSGCATMGRITGFSPQTRESFDVQEPWHNLVLRENVAEVKAVAVAYVPLPQPVPQRWQGEFRYTRTGMLLQRWVFRALVYRGESFTGIFDAVLNKQRTGFFVLLPLDNNGSAYVGNNIVILSSNAKWLMTTSGKLVDLPAEQSLMELPSGFFREHPSVLTQVVEMHRSDPAGKKFLADLEEMFLQKLVFRVKKYSGRGNAQFVFNVLTSEKYVVDRLISCGSLTASLAWLNPIGLAVSGGTQAVYDARVAMKENCDE